MPGSKKLGRGFKVLEKDARPHSAVQGPFPPEADSRHLSAVAVPEGAQPERGKTAEGGPGAGESVREIPVGSLSPNPFQPRMNFDEAGLEELVNSISASGLLQPIVLRGAGDGYEIVVGHRRYEAAKRLGMATIPGIVREIGDSGMLEMALLENIQRKDLHPVEKARAFDRLETEFNLTHSEIGKRLGMNRSTVSNYIRLLELPEEILAHVSRGTLTMGHARALLALQGNPARLAMCHKIIKEKISVRETEAQTAETGRGGGAGLKRARGKGKPAHLKDIEHVLQGHVGHRVTVSQTAKGSGKITIHFRTTDDFNSIYDRLRRALEK